MAIRGSTRSSVLRAIEGDLLKTSPSAYDSFAPYYDAFTAGSDYEAWTTQVLELATRHGWRGHTAARPRLRNGQELPPVPAARLRRDRMRRRRARCSPRRRARRPRRSSSTPTSASCQCSAVSTSSPASTTRSTTCSEADDLAAALARDRGQPRPGGPGHLRPQHAARVPDDVRARQRRACATRPSSSGAGSARRAPVRAAVRAPESTSSLRALTASTSASSRATSSATSRASASSTLLRRARARVRRASTACSTTARSCERPDEPPSSRSCTSLDTRKEVLPSDHQEDRQAGPPGTVDHEDLVTDGRTARPGTAPGRAWPSRREALRWTGRASSGRWNCVDVRRRRRLRPAAGRGLGSRDRAARPGRSLAARRARRHAPGGRAGAGLRRRARPRGAAASCPTTPCSRTPPTTRGRRAATARATTASCATSATSPAARSPPSEYQRRLREARVADPRPGRARQLGRRTRSRAAASASSVLVDGDLVEESNFNRQILYRERDIGRPKAEAAADALAEFDSSCRLVPVARRLESVDAVRQEVAGFDFVVNGADWPAHDIERWVNAACFELGVPFITMSHSPPVARVGPLYVPGSDRLLRLPGADLPRRAPALRRARRAAPRPALAGADARPGVRVRRRPGGARDAPPAHGPRARRRRWAWRTSTTCARCG